MGCPCKIEDPTIYLNCSGGTVKLVAPASVMNQYAALAGASSANYTMCLAMAFLAARRMQYWKVIPGDCTSSGTQVINTGGQITQDLTKFYATGAQVDPEPISRGILSGLASVFSGFTAAHAQAVATEQTTLCNVTLGYNYTVSQLEQLVMNGQLTPTQADSILDSAFVMLNAKLSAIKKGQNAAWGYQIAMTALKNFEEDIVFPAMASVSMPVPPAAPTTSIPVSLPAPPPTYQPAPAPSAPGLAQPISLMPASAGPSYQGASGYVPTQMNANNIGQGPTAAALPANLLTPGTILLIGGVAYIASRPGVAA